MHYRTITLKNDHTCRECGRTIPKGSHALKLLNPGNRKILGVSHINDCRRFDPILVQPRKGN